MTNRLFSCIFLNNKCPFALAKYSRNKDLLYEEGRGNFIYDYDVVSLCVRKSRERHNWWRQKAGKFFYDQSRGCDRKIYDTGLFRVAVPDGFFSKPSQEVFSVDANALVSNKVMWHQRMTIGVTIHLYWNILYMVPLNCFFDKNIERVLWWHSSYRSFCSQRS